MSRDGHQAARPTRCQVYATAGIPDYWIVNLVDDVVEVFREPEAGGYRTRLVLKPSETLQPVSFPDLLIAVNDLLP